MVVGSATLCLAKLLLMLQETLVVQLILSWHLFVLVVVAVISTFALSMLYSPALAEHGTSPKATSAVYRYASSHLNVHHCVTGIALCSLLGRLCKVQTYGAMPGHRLADGYPASAATMPFVKLDVGVVLQLPAFR